MYKIIGADGKEYGPISADVVKKWIAEGRANAQTKVLPEGATEWLTVAQVPELVVASPPAAPSPSFSQTQVMTSSKKTNPLALTGMILGIVSITFGLCCCYGLPFNIAGIVFSIIGLVQVKKNPELYSGRGMAIAGLILSLLSIVAAGAFLAIGLTLKPEQIQEWVDQLQQR